MDKVSVAEKMAMIHEQWSPRVAAEVNDFYVKLVKLQGEFMWHAHEHEDEMFYVFKGELVIRLRDRDIVLGPGEFFVIPAGVEHMPVAENECEVILFERKSTLRTGDPDADPEEIRYI
jgi:mannose-6-phosphate isomerase-like protein (cupin superfamily)